MGRHWVKVATAAAFALVLVAATAVSLWLAAKAAYAEGKAVRREQAARRLAQFFYDEAIAKVSRTRQPDRAITLQRVVDRMEARVRDGEVAFEDPLAEAYVRRMLGELLLEQWKGHSAHQHLARAHELLVQELGPDDLDTMETETNLLITRVMKGELDDTEAGLRALLARESRVLPPDDGSLMWTRMNLGWLLWIKGQLAEADEHLTAAEAVLTPAYGIGHIRGYGAMVDLAFVCLDRGDDARARRMGEQLIGLGEAAGEQGRFAVAAGRQFVGLSLVRTSREKAIIHLERAYEEARRACGEDDLRTLSAEGSLALVYHWAGRYKQAGELLRRMLGRPSRDPLDQPSPSHSAFAEAMLAHCEAMLGNTTEGIRKLNEARKAMRTHPGPHPMPIRLPAAQAMYGSLLLKADRLTEAEGELLAAYRLLSARADKTAFDHHMMARQAARWLAELYAARKEPQKAVEWRERANEGPKGAAKP